MPKLSESQFVKRPSFCYIAPISYLDHYTEVSKTHLVLAHLVDESDAYANFYKVLAGNGHVIFMDNSAYELKVPYAPEKLIELAAKCGAHAVVLPDYPFQPGGVTIEAAIKFIPQFKEAGLKTFFVPQSKTGDLDDWIQSYEWAAKNPDIDIIGMSILGVPNALSNIDPTYSRVVMSQLLLDRGIYADWKHHHYLGLNTGPALEVPSLIRMGTMHTMDSSGPIWTAILGHEYTKNADSYMSVIKPKQPVDFHIARSKDKVTLARVAHNIAMTQALFENTGDIGVWYAEE